MSGFGQEAVLEMLVALDIDKLEAITMIFDADGIDRVVIAIKI